MAKKRTYKRKLLNFSIKRDMQFKMIGKIFTLLFISLLLCGLIYYYFANQQITSSFQLFHIKARNFLDFLLPAVIASFVVSLLVGVFGSLFFPKPIAGGLYRIEEDLKLVNNTGDLRLQIKLRNGDQTQPLADEVNSLLADMRERITRSQQALAELEQLTHSGTDHERERMRQLQNQLQADIGGLKV